MYSQYTYILNRILYFLDISRDRYVIGSVFSFVRKVIALPVLPPGHVEETFHNLDRNATNDQLDSLMGYMWRQWIRNLIFPIKNLSVFMLLVRTKNDLEGWHNRINSRVNRTAKILSIFSLWNCKWNKEHPIDSQASVRKENGKDQLEKMQQDEWNVV